MPVRLRLYPLCSEDFMNRLFERIDPSRSPIYTTHFQMRKPS